MTKKTLAQLTDLQGKRVLVRVDFNVPLDGAGNITSDRRIRAALPTIRHILDQGGSAILMSHLGRPKSDPATDAPLTMDKVAARLGELLGKRVRKLDEVVGPTVEAITGDLGPGEVCVLENLRFHPGEQASDAAFAGQLAALADVYVNDAFGTCHREDASMVAVPMAMAGKPRVVGFLVAKELHVLDKLLSQPARPFVAVLGGAKVSDKIGFIKALLPRVDRVLIGGAMAYTFLKAVGVWTGASRVETDKLDLARELLQLGQGKIMLPVDHFAVPQLDMPTTGSVVEESIPEGWMGVDIGPKTTIMYRDVVLQSRTVIWNGPVGKFEDAPYSKGTRAIADAMGTVTQFGSVTVVGGGETAEAVEAFHLDQLMTHVSTGGGAFLEYVEGTPFAALGQIEDA